MTNLRAGPIGRSLLAMRDNEIGARSVGVDVRTLKVFIFTVSAVIAGIGGALARRSKAARSRRTRSTRLPPASRGSRSSWSSARTAPPVPFSVPPLSFSINSVTNNPDAYQIVIGAVRDVHRPAARRRRRRRAPAHRLADPPGRVAASLSANRPRPARPQPVLSDRGLAARDRIRARRAATAVNRMTEHAGARPARRHRHRQAVRRPYRRRRCLGRDQRRQDRRADRAERRRQDHAVPVPDRRRDPRRRSGAAQRRDITSLQLRRAGAARHRPYLPAARDLRDDDRRRQPAGRRGEPYDRAGAPSDRRPAGRPDRRHRRRPSAARTAGRRGHRPARAWPTCATRRPAPCRPARFGWSSSAGRCATTRRCCCSTNPRAGSTRPRPHDLQRVAARRRRRPASPSCSSSTTSTSSSISPTGSTRWPRAG